MLPFNKFILITPWEQSVGNAAEQIYYGCLSARMKGKELVIILRQPGLLRKLISRISNPPITNKELFNVRSEGLIIPADHPLLKIAGKILDIVYVFLGLLNLAARKLLGNRYDSVINGDLRQRLEMPSIAHFSIFNPDGHKSFSREKAKAYDWQSAVNTKVDIHLAAEKNFRCANELKRMGIPDGAKFVCLHVRETGFYKESKDQGGYRSADINNYLNAVDLIHKKGYWVIRMGDRSMTRVKVGKMLIDYPFTEYKSDLMDLYLIKHCSLYIGMDSGIWDVAHMFQKDTILTNLTNWGLALPPKRRDLMIIKHFYSISKKRFLSVKEFLEEPHSIQFHFGGYPGRDKTDYIIVENYPKDLVAVVEEKLSQDADYKYDGLQELFLKKRKQQIERWMDTDPRLTRSVGQAYRLATRYDYQGVPGKQFLKDYWEYGEKLEKMTKEFKICKSVS